MGKSEFMRTWQIDWVRDRSHGVREGHSRVSIYPDPGGLEGGVLIRYTDFGKSYPSLQNGHYLGRSGHVAAMASMNRKIILHVNGNKLFATAQHLWLLRVIERTFPVMAKRLRPLLLCLLGRAAWSAAPI